MTAAAGPAGPTGPRAPAAVATAHAVAARTNVVAGAVRVWRREAVVFKHLAKWLFLPNVLDPILYLAALGLGLGTYLTSVDGQRYIDFLAPGLMASSVMWTASFESTWNITMKIDSNHTFDAMLAGPLDAPDLILGEIAWGATRALLCGVTFLAVLVVFGLVHSPWAAAMPVAAVLVGAAFSALGLLAAVLVLDLAFWGYYFVLVITPMFLISGVFFPLTRLPVWAQTAAQLSPLYHGAALMREFASGAVGVSTLGHIGALVAVTLVLIPPAVWRFRRRVLS